MAGLEAVFPGYIGCYVLVNVFSSLIYESSDLKDNGTAKIELTDFDNSVYTSWFIIYSDFLKSWVIL